MSMADPSSRTTPRIVGIGAGPRLLLEPQARQLARELRKLATNAEHGGIWSQGQGLRATVLVNLIRASCAETRMP